MRGAAILLDMPRKQLVTLGSRVRLVREEELKCSQGELAAEVRRRGVRVTNSQISAIERGTSSPSWEVAIALADVLNVSLDYLALRSDVLDAHKGEEIAEAPAQYFSPQADELARIVDDLPPYRRDEVLAHARILAVMEAEAERNVSAEIDKALTEIKAAGLIVGEDAARRVRAALANYASALLGPNTLGAIDGMAGGGIDAQGSGRRKTQG